MRTFATKDSTDIAMAKKGKRKAAAIDSLWDEVEGELLQGFDNKDRKRLRKLLRRADTLIGWTFDKGFDCLVPRGMMVLYGQSSGPVEPFDPQLLNRKGSLFLQIAAELPHILPHVFHLAEG
jgi:NADPH:quinone reductase-like Zn-dependent oxidoreductase